MKIKKEKFITAVPFFGSMVPLYTVKDLRSDQDEKLDGCCMNHPQKVFIDDDLTLEEEQETIIHEFVHAVSDFYLLDLSEKDVTCLGRGLVQLMKPFLNQRRLSSIKENLP